MNVSVPQGTQNIKNWQKANIQNILNIFSYPILWDLGAGSKTNDIRRNQVLYSGN